LNGDNIAMPEHKQEPCNVISKISMENFLHVKKPRTEVGDSAGSESRDQQS
jgi:hypothetical protein